MSKIGKKIIEIKEGISVVLEDHEVKVNGPKGSLSFKIPSGITVEVADNKIQVGQKKKNDDNTKPLFGLTRSVIQNMIIGVFTGFEKRLELSGVGYRAQMSGEDLMLLVGFSHPVKIASVPGIKFSVSENTIVVSGIDKELVGNVASRIRAIRPPEPYKGKGIKYKGEKIRRKAGKAVKAVGAK